MEKRSGITAQPLGRRREITRYQGVNTRPLRKHGPDVLAQLLTLMFAFIFILKWF